MTQWYVAQRQSDNALAVKQLPLPHGWLTLDGPFSSRAKAETALIKDRGTSGGTTTTSSGVKWWVHWTRQLANGQWTGRVYSLPPNSAPIGFRNNKMTDDGPFDTKAQAESDLKAGAGPQSQGPGFNVSLPGNPLDALGNIGDFFGRLAEPSTWIRVGEVAIGALALGIGLYVMVKDTSAGKKARSAAKGVTSLALGASTGGASKAVKPPTMPRATKAQAKSASAKPSVPRTGGRTSQGSRAS